MKSLFLFVLCFYFSQMLFAQDVFTEEMEVDSIRPAILDNLNVNQDVRLDKMLKWHIEQNESLNGISGFRVEIFFSSNSDAKEKAFRKKVEFLSVYPNNTVHVKYDIPNFRVRVGDFRTKNEALKLYKEIKSTYPVAFIIADDIEFPLKK